LSDPDLIASAAQLDDFLLGLVRPSPRSYAERAGESVANVRWLLAELGHPERGLRCVHVAGSKGKGSVALMLEALLAPHEPALGTFTSPHLVRWNERIRIRGASIDDASLFDTMQRLRTLLSRATRTPSADGPSFFDVLTAGAIQAFRDAGCRMAILECGLGGEHDATNALDGEAACITSLELEHTDKLGQRLAQIAWHKAGVARPDRPLVCGPLPAQALATVMDRCRERGARAVLPGRDYRVHLHTVTHPAAIDVEVRHGAQRARFRLPGNAPHMAHNAAVALVLAWRLGAPEVDPGVLQHLTLPGRAQVLREHPTVIADGAHTAASLQALSRSLSPWPARQRVFLLSATQGKSPQALARLVHGARAVVVTRVDPLRSLPARTLAAGLHDALADTLVVCEEPELALQRALALTPEDGVLCACGSVYMAGFVLRQLAPGD
jgi:folylpolyglutamate synthase/dihydrofolate synthase